MILAPSCSGHWFAIGLLVCFLCATLRKPDFDLWGTPCFAIPPMGGISTGLPLTPPSSPGGSLSTASSEQIHDLEQACVLLCTSRMTPGGGDAGYLLVVHRLICCSPQLLIVSTRGRTTRDRPCPSRLHTVPLGLFSGHVQPS